MEFNILKQDNQPYVDKTKELIFQQRTKKISEEKILENVIKYFEECDLKWIRGETIDFESCYEFALDKLEIRVVSRPRFAEFINKNNRFEEINSKEEIKLNQLVVYYSNPIEYLHAGIIESINNEKIRVISQWGDTMQLIHPIERIDNTYGDKYKIFNVKKD